MSDIGMYTMCWSVLFVVLCVVEVATMGLTTIWFAIGALLAVVLAALNVSLWIQVAVFLVVSLVLLFFTRPIALKYFNGRREKTNVESLVGEVVLVKEAINNLQGEGAVLVKGIEWSAKAEQDDLLLAAGQKVRIKEIRGVCAIVAPVEDQA